jgi:hypothetical protein
MHILIVRAATKNLAITVGKFAVQLAERSDLGRTYERKILGPEEVELPLSG